MAVTFSKHDVSIHILDLDTFSGVLHAEVCVRGKDHVGIYPTVLMLDNPRSVVDDIAMATKDLLDQQGPFKASGGCVEQEYDNAIRPCKDLMLAKNHDYGDSWREMRLTSITDQILVKARRIKRIEDLRATGRGPMVSEGIKQEYRDMLNYCVFALIKIGASNENSKS